MCWRCAAVPIKPRLLSRRSFHQGVLAAGFAQPVSAVCFPPAPDDLVEPAMHLMVASDAPRTVTLTLDACSGEADRRIIDTLVSLSIPATIFVTGLWLRGNAPTLALLRERSDLFALQNHGAQHLPPVLGNRLVYGLKVAGTLAAIRQEVSRGADLMEADGLAPPRWYRGAAGLYSPSAIAPIQAMGYLIAGYSLNGDAGASLPAAVVARRIAAARSGDVIVSHVNQPHRPSGAGVAAGIAELHRAGVVFVALDALPTSTLTCAVHAPAHHPAHQAPVS